MIIRSVLAAKVLPWCSIFAVSAWLSACHSGDSTTTVDTTDVSLQAADCAVSATTPSATANACDDHPGFVQQLPVNTQITDNVPQGGYAVYQVPSDTQIVLTTIDGNANLYLYDSIDFDDNNLLCAANQPFLEDICSASVDDGELYAVVEGRESSNYQLVASDDCSVEAVNQWVYRNMQDYYLYADQVPTVNPNSYTDPAELLRELRFEELDPYSSISDAVAREAFLNDGKSYGFGFNWRYDANRNARIVFVFTDSPFGRAGIKRGDIIVSIEGELWNEMSAERYFELTGNVDSPRTSTWTFIDGETQTTKSVAVTFGEFTAQTVLYNNTFTHEAFSGKVGYLMFNEFLATADAELDVAIQQLKDQGTTELILDMRYNRGGYLYIAGKLASQLGGPSLNGNTLVRYEYNRKYPQANFQTTFEATTPSLSLNRVVVLTTPWTASAAEIVINSLRPYMEVITIGGTTRGKAFISSSRQFCGLALNAMEAEGVNASGVSVAGGIAADCYAADDPTRRFGAQSGEMEGMLQSALDYYVHGSCDIGPALSKTTAHQQTPPLTDHLTPFMH